MWKQTPRHPVNPFGLTASGNCHGHTSANASPAHPANSPQLSLQSKFCVAGDYRESVSCLRIFCLNGKWKMPTSVTSTKLAEAVQSGPIFRSLDTFWWT